MNTYCVKYKKDTENIDPKMFRTVCRSNKSKFLKQKCNNKKQFFEITKHAHVL